MKKSILFVIPSLTSGGAEGALVSMLSIFDYQKYDVDLLILQQDLFYLPLLSKQVNIIELSDKMKQFFGPFKNLFKLNKTSFFIFIIRLIAGIWSRIFNVLFQTPVAQTSWEVIRSFVPEFEKKYDVAIGYLQTTSIYFIIDKVQADKKIGWFHNDYIMGKYDAKRDRPYFNQLNYLFGVSEDCCNILAEIFKENQSKIRLMYNIVNPDLIKHKANSAPDFADNFAGLKLLTIGRLHPQKGYDLALESCLKLKQDNLLFKWYVIGDGPDKIKIMNKIKEMNLEDRFILLGEKINPYPFIKEADIYIQPSLFEGHCIAVHEARVLNRPIIITNCPSMSAQISNGMNGFIVEKTSDALYQAIKFLIANPEIRKKFSDALASQEHGTKNEIMKLYEVIEDNS